MAYRNEKGRYITRQVLCGGVPIGGGSKISIQSMTNTDTKDADATAGQIIELAEAGCDIVRCAVPDESSSESIPIIKDILAKKGFSIPIVADIHFDYRLALSAIKNGADKIRINPGNIGGDEGLKKVVFAAKEAGIPIRIGVNSGSLRKDLLDEYGPTPIALVKSAIINIESIGKMGFEDIVVSVKSSNVKDTIEVGRMLANECDCPLHLGVTEAGSSQAAVIKSAMGIGALLAEGIGDTIRVSLTGDPVKEVYAAREILAGLDLLPGSIDIISCPTCGRCKVDLAEITAELKKALIPIEKDRLTKDRLAKNRLAENRLTENRLAENRLTENRLTENRLAENSLAENRLAKDYPQIKVAIMGCSVNGPGEAKHADLGVACGTDGAVYFEKGKTVRRLQVSEIIPTIIDGIKSLSI